jgi:hypothetical protein
MTGSTRLPLLSVLLGTALLLGGCGGSEAGAESGVPRTADGAAAADPAVPAAEPAAPRNVRDRAPAQIRGIYLNAYAAGSRTRLPRLIALADSTEINTFVIDVKDEKGIRYNSEIALAMELAQPGEVTIRDLRAMVDTLKAHGIYTMARIVIFKDPILSKARPQWSIRNPTGGIWVDRAGNTWVSPWDKNVWEYNIQIGEEVARAGFDEIQYDYVRFPEQYRSLPTQVHPNAQGDRTDAIAAFLNEARRRLHPLGVVVAADVFGLSPNEASDVGIGQQWETISAVADHILPMMYPSHYLPTHLPGVRTPDLMPYEVLFKSAGMAVIRNNQLREAGAQPARIIPWLQTFTASWLRNHRTYGAEELRLQKKGVYDVGLDDWVLWHPGSRYEPFVGGLDRELRSHARTDYTPPPEVQSALNLFERQGIRDARQRAAEQARGQTTDPEAAQAARTGEEPES